VVWETVLKQTAALDVMLAGTKSLEPVYPQHHWTGKEGAEGMGGRYQVMVN